MGSLAHIMSDKKDSVLIEKLRDIQQVKLLSKFTEKAYHTYDLLSSTANDKV